MPQRKPQAPPGPHVLDVLGDPVRRSILERLGAEGELSSGELVDAVRSEFGISQPAVSQHLRVLRESGLVVVRVDGQRRLYGIDGEGLQRVDAWLAPFRAFWEHRLDALATEVARGKRERKRRAALEAAAAPAAATGRKRRA